MLPSLLILAGLDPSGGAGLLADIETARELGIRTQAIVTALTIQNDDHYVGHDIVPPELIHRQLGLLPPFHGIKIGMLPSLEQIRVLVHFLKERRWTGPLIWDPVFASSSGGTLFPLEQLGEALRLLAPHLTAVTPNLPELETLLKRPFREPERDLIELYRVLKGDPPLFIVVKGGHGPGAILTDWFYDGDGLLSFPHPRMDRPKNKRGTGCRLATALAATLLSGKSKLEAVQIAMDYVQQYLS